ncbi:MAG: HDIG domain-containing protein [Prevotellaceae bacterium]|jgi:putative nucleotidyltransferase with HDIG domain|nr:HDIG domain-containing protein [Prevotellaceae bacterium]
MSTTSKNTIKTWEKLVLFISASILLVLSLPHNSAFHYEFQKGKQWMAEDIVSPFDFPVYKTADELYADHNRIMQTYKPYFQYDASVEQQQISAFSANLETLTEPKYNREKNILLNLLKDAYQRYIVQKNDIPQIFTNRQSLVISIIKNNIYEDYPISEIFNTEDAYRHIHSELSKQTDAATLQHIFSKIDIRNYIKTNIYFDEAVTNKIKDQLVENISITKGIVPAGTKLIARGETVNSKNIDILESFKKEYMNGEGFLGNFWLVLSGQILLVLICLFQLYLMLSWYQPEIFNRAQNLAFILLLTIVAVFGSIQVIKSGINIYIVPLTVVPIYVGTFFRSRTAIFIYLTIIMLVFIYAPNSFEFTFVSLAAGIISVSQFRTWYRRGRLFVAIGLIFLFYVLSYVTVCLIKDGLFESIDLTTLLIFGANAIFVLFGCQLIYVFEKLFGFLSNSTLMELSDTNRTLLRQLAEKAPGTFQHSMQVANLAEEVVRQISGETLLVRVGALYHDIGKIMNPEYFIENQQLTGYSLHEKMKPEESAKIIIKHVEDGIALAKKYNLPNKIIDFIKTHHAKSYTRYFLSKYREQNPDATDFSAFAYPGPNPGSKELAVLMMADSIEAASRSLQTVTPETISDLVEKITDYQIANGYLSDSDLTFSELALAKEIFKSKLKNIYHARIEYPSNMP